jgi:ATP-dependent RNA helicase DHX57
VDCVENFRAMQDCFRQHPDIYGNEIDDDEDDEEEKKEEEEEKKEEKA